MSDISTAVDAIRKQARLYEPLVKVAAELEKIGSLDNAVKEHEASITALSGEKDKLDKEVKKLKGKLSEGLDNIQSELTAMKGAANAEIDAAKQTAANLIADAKEKSASILAKAEGKANDLLSSARGNLSEIEVKALAANADLQSALISKAAAQDELDKINKIIDGAKSKLANLLG